jgi:CRISPR-associated protein Cmr4
MYERAAVVSLYAETPLHPGRGGASGVIDLPIQRERQLGYPMIPGSSLKGVLRSQARQLWRQQAGRLETVFGPETDRAGEHGGALAITDARLLLFPVRSLRGVFAWTTSPLALDRYRRDLVAAGFAAPSELPAVPSGRALVAPGTALAAAGSVTLEEFSFAASEDPAAAAIAHDLASSVLPSSPEYESWRARLPRQLVILPDDDFRDFVQTATEVVARIRVDPATGTVAPGALWYEEYLPTETLFYALALASLPRRPTNGAPEELRTAEDVLDALDGLALDRLQIGGDETVGRGIVKLRIRRREGAA